MPLRSIFQIFHSSFTRTISCNIRKHQWLLCGWQKESKMEISWKKNYEFSTTIVSFFELIEIVFVKPFWVSSQNRKSLRINSKREKEREKDIPIFWKQNQKRTKAKKRNEAVLVIVQRNALFAYSRAPIAMDVSTLREYISEYWKEKNAFAFQGASQYTERPTW